MAELEFDLDGKIFRKKDRELNDRIENSEITIVGRGPNDYPERIKKEVNDLSLLSPEKYISLK